MGKNIRDILREYTSVLRECGIESAGLDIQLLLAHVLEKDRLYVLANPSHTLTLTQMNDLQTLVTRRAQHEPIAYIIGYCEFMSLKFAVNRHTLIPRADTETLAETAIEKIRKEGVKNVLEIGTGSGCIAISLAVNCPDLHVTALDISSGALQLAQANANTHEVSQRINFLHGDIFDHGLTARLERSAPFGAIVSNPPYISAPEMLCLPPSVHLYEPHTALQGGQDGIVFYDEIARRAPGLLEAPGLLLLEIGWDQADSVSFILKQQGFDHIGIIRDLCGKNRVLAAKRVLSVV